MEELALRDPDRSGWEALCGKYDYVYEDFRIDEILMKNAELYMKACCKGKTAELRMYPLGENSFGVKCLGGKLSFGDGGLTLRGRTGKKLSCRFGSGTVPGAESKLR